MSSAALLAASLATLLAAPAAAAQAAADSARTPIVIRAARLLDGTGAAAVTNAAIVVLGDRIRHEGGRDSSERPSSRER